ncbi:chloride channel protein [Rudaeicoccus suwonensis]|uniref:chloride channel protein n=1 Tax=Rudaeicoccus suwonensis TaxID=657409 RepID=UPI001BA62AD8|nr:chloride channel protein [Rudaeicoccus suwonensis]
MSSPLTVTPRYLLAVVVVGLGSGVAGAALTLLLHAVQRVVFGYTGSLTFLVGVEHASPARRVIGMTIAGVIIAPAWWLLRSRRTLVSVPAALRDEQVRLPGARTTVDAVLQIVAVGAGASLGREGAPRQLAGAIAVRVGEWLALDATQRRVLLACAAGAGLGAVYNTPLAGAAFAVEILLLTTDLLQIGTAAVVSAVAVVVAWPVVSSDPTYVIGAHRVGGGSWIWAVLAGPLCWAAGRGWLALMAAAKSRDPDSPTRDLPWRMAGAMCAVGVVAIALPQITGNGKGIMQTVTGAGTIGAGLLALLVIAKPLVTALCLRGGLVGGLITPSMSTGAAIGALVSLGLGQVLGSTSMVVCAMVGAAAMLAATQHAPITAAVFMLELAHAPWQLMPPIFVAVAVVGMLEHRLPMRR